MKKNLIRALSIACITVMTVSFMAGCSGEKKVVTPSTTETTKTAAIKMETISLWTNNAAQKAEDEKVINAFNTGTGKDKGINIEYKLLGGDYENILKIALASAEGPHIFKVAAGAITLISAVDAGWVIPIDDMTGGKEFLKKFDGSLVQNTTSYKGKTYMLPYSINSQAVAYNKDLLKKNGFNNPPKTWSELRDMAKTITRNGNGKEFGFIEGLKSTGYAKWNGLYQATASVGHAEFDIKSGKFRFADFADYYQILVDMNTDGSWFPGVEGMNNDQARAQFAEGNIGFKNSASWDAGVWKDQFPAKMDWGFCRPIMDTNKQFKYYTELNAIYGFGVKAKQSPEKSLEVMSVMHSDAAIIANYEAGKAIPYKNELVKASKNSPTVKNFAEVADLTGSQMFPANPIGAVSVEGDNLYTAVAKILTRAAPVKSTLEDLDKRYNAALEKSIAGGFDIAPFVNKDFDIAVKK